MVIRSAWFPVFEKYRDIYDKIFACMYPAKNSSGFPERNLSVNFSKAVEALYPSAVSWFEFQFGEKNNLHMDAVIVIPEIKTALIVESKRFSNPEAKKAEFKSDMLRSEKVSTEYYKEFETRITDLGEYSILGVMLADVWTETPTKTDIKASFDDKSFVGKLFTAQEGAPFSDAEPFVYDFTAESDKKDWKKKYFLLSLVWEIKEAGQKEK